MLRDLSTNHLEDFLSGKRSAVIIHAKGRVTLELVRDQLSGVVKSRVLIAGIPMPEVNKGLEFVSKIVSFVIRNQTKRGRTKK